MMFYLPGTKLTSREVISGRVASGEGSGNTKDRFGNDAYQLLPIEVRLNRDP